MEQLKKLAQQIKSEEIRSIVDEALNKPNNLKLEKFGDEVDFESSPASKKVHHSYPGGLIEHTLAVTEMSLGLATVIEKVYDVKMNKDLLIAGGILHDFYKTMTYKKDGDKYDRSVIGAKIDHLTLTVSEFYDRVPLDLLHVLVAHHGKGGPTTPRSLEALIVHLADYCDSEFMNETLFGAKDLSQKAGKKIKNWNSKKAIEICQFMAAGGLDGVKKYLNKE